MNYLLILTIITIIVAAWFAWRYIKLRRKLDEYSNQVRQQYINTEIKELDSLSSSISSIISTFNLQHSTLDAERARLATVLEQMTDGTKTTR